MLDRRVSHSRSLIDDYCLQLGLLVERRHTERALIEAREQALHAAHLAEQAMHEAQAADRAKAKFLGNMTHELRTPLNAIIGFSEIIEAAPHQAETSLFAKHIKESGTQLLGILNGVLDLARIEAGKMTLDEQLVDIAEVVQAAMRPIRTIAADKSLTIHSAEVGSIGIRVDAGKMTQAVSNLLSNAVKFTGQSGRIEIGAALDETGDLSLTISDTGCGIPTELLSKVVEPFSQVEEHLTRENDGIGVGLPIATALVRLHGGDIILESAIGAGTTAHVRLPRDRVYQPDC